MKTSTKRNLIIGGLAIGTTFAIYKAVNGRSDSGGTGTGTSEFPLKQGSRGNNVSILQRYLVSKGGSVAQSITSTGGIDGIWGKGTQSAVVKAGLPNIITELMLRQLTSQTSIPSTPTIFSSVFPLMAGSTGEQVKKLQEFLIKKGGAAAVHIRTTGGADGQWGRGTTNAVKVANLPSSISHTLYKKLIGG